jgi:hypothetical protein
LVIISIYKSRLEIEYYILNALRYSNTVICIASLVIISSLPTVKKGPQLLVLYLIFLGPQLLVITFSYFGSNNCIAHCCQPEVVLVLQVHTLPWGPCPLEHYPTN